MSQWNERWHHSQCQSVYLNPEIKSKTLPNGAADAIRTVLGYKSSSPPLGRWRVGIWCVSGNSLADKKEMGSQTHYPIRPRALRIGQLKCNSDLKATQLRLRCCSAAMGEQEHLWTALVLRFWGSPFIRNASPNLKMYCVTFEKVLKRGKALLTAFVSLEAPQKRKIHPGFHWKEPFG